MVINRELYIATIFLAALSAPAFAADLTSTQQKLFKDAQTHMVQVQTNLKLAQETSAGNPSASKAKLAFTRIDSTRQSIEQVKARLVELPAANADVESLQKQLDAAVKAVEVLEAHLTGKKDDKPQEKTTSPPGAQQTPKQPQANPTVPLDYRQQEELKNARFYVTEVEGLAGGVQEIVEKVNPVADPKTLDFELIQKGMNTITKARERAKLARERLDILPPTGSGVKETIDDLDKALASVAESEKVLTPIHATLSAIINPANYASLTADTARLNELAAMFADLNVFTQNREKATAIVKEMQAASAEHERLIKSYADLIRQQTPEGTKLESASRHFQDKYGSFAAAVAKQKETLPAEIDEDLKKAHEAADKAVADKNPAYYSGAVSQQMGLVDEKIALLEAIDANKAIPAKDHVAKARQSLKQRQDILKESIIAANELPPDRFKGSDRDQLGKLATEAWLKVQPGAKVLAIRIPSQDWNHEVLWRHQTDSWYKIDRSKIQVQLLVGHDDKLAVVQPIDLWKNHLEADAIIASPLHEKDAELSPRDFLLLDKVK